MKRVVIAHPGSETIARLVAEAVGASCTPLETRRFPDGETFVRLDPGIAGRQVIFACSLDRPDEKFLRVVFSCAGARDMGASGVGLVAPYLAYMRQDKAFHPGEAVTARHFASTLSPWIDWLVTVDPHLHRIHALSDVYSARAAVAHAAPAIADWISRNVPDPVLLGPDVESEQWVGDIARRAGAPHVALRKTRLGDSDVRVEIPDLDRWRGRTPVIVDDIISTGRSMIETVSGIRSTFTARPVCVGVHAVFSGDSYAALVASGVERIVTCNTISHETNGIDIAGALAEKVLPMLGSLS